MKILKKERETVEEKKKKNIFLGDILDLERNKT